MSELCYSCKKIILQFLKKLNESSYFQKQDGARELSISPQQRLIHRLPITRLRGAAGLRGLDKAPANRRPVPPHTPVCSLQ